MTRALPPIHFGDHLFLFHIYSLIMYYISCNTRVLSSANNHLFSPKISLPYFRVVAEYIDGLNRIACRDDRHYVEQNIKWQRNMYFECAIFRSKQQPSILTVMPKRIKM